MSLDLFQYDRMVQRAMRGVVWEALTKAATDGMLGQHHFYISFRTDFAGVRLSDALRARFPEDMTIVLQHQYWGLAVHRDFFEVTLSFSGIQEKLVIPLASITGFVDPSVKFGLQFKPELEGAERAGILAPPAAKPDGEPAEPGAPQEAEIVALDAFRKK